MTISQHADHNRAHYRFSREQSRSQRDMEWENETPPVFGWWKDWLAAIVVLGLMCLSLPFARLVACLVAP